MRPLWQSGVPTLAAVAAALAVGGCNSEGEYQVSWTFADEAPGGPWSARECGRHAVEAFSIVGTKEGGDGDSFITPCGPGGVVRSVSPGRWTLAVMGLDAAGRGLGSDDDGKALRGTTEAFDVEKDGPPVPARVVIEPRPSCSDGIDNDGDGAVDGDDSDCQSDPKSEPRPGPSPGPSPSPASPNP